MISSAGGSRSECSEWVPCSVEVIYHPRCHRRARPGSSEVCSSVSASKEIHSFSGIVRKTVETRVSINAAMIPTQKSAFAIFAFE